MTAFYLVPEAALLAVSSLLVVLDLIEPTVQRDDKESAVHPQSHTKESPR